MLEIYYADLATPFVPEDPDRLELAGSIDLDAHRLLVTKAMSEKLRLQCSVKSLLKKLTIKMLLRLSELPSFLVGFLVNLHLDLPQRSSLGQNRSFGPTGPKWIISTGQRQSRSIVSIWSRDNPVRASNQHPAEARPQKHQQSRRRGEIIRKRCDCYRWCRAHRDTNRDL